MKAPKQLLTVMLVVSVAACAALTTDPRPEENAEIRLDRGLFALDAGRYVAAFDDLAWVYTHCSGHQAGSRALLALAALELDARNDAARPQVGTELLGRAIRDPGTTRWVRPLAETAFLTSLALGAPRPDDADVEDAGAAETPAADTAGPAADTAAEALDEEGHEEHGADIPSPLAAPTDVADVADVADVRGCGPAVAAVRGADSVARPLPELPGPSMAALLARSEARRDSVAASSQALRAELATVQEQLRVTQEELERIRKTLKP